MIVAEEEKVEEEVNRRLALLPDALLHSIDHQIKVALVQNDYVDLDSFPTTECGWNELGRLCNCTAEKLNKVRNCITALQP